MKKFKQFNESIRDKMTPVSEEEMKSRMGEEKFNNWKKINSVRNSIEYPLYLISSKNDTCLKIETEFNRFNITIENNKWSLDYINNKDQSDILYYNTWDEVLKKCKEISIDDINAVLIEKQKEIDLTLSEMDNMKKDLSELKNG